MPPIDWSVVVGLTAGTAIGYAIFGRRPLPPGSEHLIRASPRELAERAFTTGCIAFFAVVLVRDSMAFFGRESSHGDSSTKYVLALGIGLAQYVVLLAPRARLALGRGETPRCGSPTWRRVSAGVTASRPSRSPESVQP